MSDVLRFGHPDRPPTAWTAQDLAGTVRAFGPWWSLLAAGVPGSIVDGARARSSRLLADGSPTAADVDECLALLSDAGRALHEGGHGAPAAVGTVASVHASGGGLPKPPVDGGMIGWRGLEGDRQKTRKHHGRVWQALCLWSVECIDALSAEGHPIRPGCAGENVTIAGIDIAALRPGTLLQVGDAVCEISVPATPCFKLIPYFAGGDFHRIHHETNPGWSRLYATVVRPGDVEPGDPVVVEPPLRW